MCRNMGHDGTTIKKDKKRSSSIVYFSCHWFCLCLLHRVKFLLCSIGLSLYNGACMYCVLFVYYAISFGISFAQFFSLEFIALLPLIFQFSPTYGDKIVAR